MNWTPEKLKALFPNATADFIKQNCSGREASGPEPEQRGRGASHGDSPVKARHPRKRLVRIACFRARQLQDPDNGIYKWHIDAIRRAGLLDDDTAEAMRLEIQPETKVATEAEARTEITVEAL